LDANPNEERLAWPPRAEDLRRLYVAEHLSAAKIAASPPFCII